jgi:hypothetical protein
MKLKSWRGLTNGKNVRTKSLELLKDYAEETYKNEMLNMSNLYLFVFK